MGLGLVDHTIQAVTLTADFIELLKEVLVNFLLCVEHLNAIAWYTRDAIFDTIHTVLTVNELVVFALHG